MSRYRLSRPLPQRSLLSAILIPLCLAATTIAYPQVTPKARSSAPINTNIQPLTKKPVTKPPLPKFAKRIPVKCIACRPIPYRTPDILPIQGLPKGSLNLMGPIVLMSIGPGEKAQGDWATNTIQTNIGQTPDRGELVRLSEPLDLLFGEVLPDATWQSPVPATRVKNPSVVFQVPVSFTGSGLQFTGPDYSCSAAAECVPNYISDGEYGVYFARVEDCLSATDHVTVQQVKDNQGNPIPCNSADGVLGNNGYWYDIAPAWKATISLGPSNETTQTLSGTLKIPAQLPVPANYVRIEILLGLQDNPSAGSGWIGSLYWGSAEQSGAYGGPEHALTRVALQLPTITVLPAAFIQMKVLPYTIVYRPPGDQSSGTYTATQSFGTNMTVGNNTTLDNSQSFENSFDVKNDDKVTALIATADLADGQSTTTSSGWDNNTVIGTGLTVSNSHTVVRSFTVGSSTADPSIIPASAYVAPNTCTPGNFPATCTVQPGETYQQEPFWEDRVVLLLDPQAALWDFNDVPAIQLLGALDFDEISIRDLDTCASNTTQNAWRLVNGEYLTPAECHDLARLDPFYGSGQWISPSVLGRGLSIGSGTYGRDPLNPSSTATVKFSDIFNYQTQQSTNGTATYSATVTDILGYSWSAGLSLAYKQSAYGLSVGFDGSNTVTQGEKITNGTTMKVAYSASTVATSTSATEIDGVFGDDHDFYTPECQQSSGNCYIPSVHVYIDELFGSYMFQDTNAPCGSLALAACAPPKWKKKVLVPIKGAQPIKTK